jgi:DNA adenine methylase
MMANINLADNLQINFEAETQNKAITGYPGGKSGAGVYQTIICQIPPIAVYIEPFIGGGGIYHNLRLPKKVILGDIDPAVIDKYGYGCRQVNGCSIDIKCKDYRFLIAECNYQGPILVYLDPPYLKSTRSQQGNLYRHEFTIQDHIDLINYAAGLKCLVMISHYPCQLYDSRLKHWRHLDYQSMTHGGMRTERLYMNYPQPNTLQDYRYIGKDFTDRQRIKRKIAREIKKLHHMPALERNAILQAINEKYL